MVALYSQRLAFVVRSFVRSFAANVPAFQQQRSDTANVVSQWMTAATAWRLPQDVRYSLVVVVVIIGRCSLVGVHWSLVVVSGRCRAAAIVCNVATLPSCDGLFFPKTHRRRLRVWSWSVGRGWLDCRSLLG